MFNRFNVRRSPAVNGGGVFWAMDFGCNFTRLPIDAGSHQDEFDIKQGESC